MSNSIPPPRENLPSRGGGFLFLHVKIKYMKERPAEQLTFSKFDTGKSTTIDLVRKEKLGSGDFGDVYRVEAEIPESNRPQIFALKTFKDVEIDKDFNTTAKQNAQHAVVIHTYLKQLGIPTWTTYRLSNDQTEVLMSCYGDKDHEYLIDMHGAHELQDVEITNLEEAVHTFIDPIINSQYVIQCGEDSFFILYDSEQRKIRIIIGDMDSVRIDPPVSDAKQYNKQTVLRAIKWIQIFARVFIKDNSNLSVCEACLEQVEESV